MFVNTIITFSIVYVINYWKVTSVVLFVFYRKLFPGAAAQLENGPDSQMGCKINRGTNLNMKSTVSPFAPDGFCQTIMQYKRAWAGQHARWKPLGNVANVFPNTSGNNINFA